MSFTRSFVVALATISLVPFALATGCVVGAPPAEDVVGEGLKSTDGKLLVDRDRVPLIDVDDAECGRDEIIVKNQTGEYWHCEAKPEGGATYTGGNGIAISTGAAPTISADFGIQDGQVARGNTLEEVRLDVVQLQNSFAVDGVGGVSITGPFAAENVTFTGQKLCVYDGGGILVGADWTQARCIELVGAIGASNPRFACLQPNDFDIGDGPVTDGGIPPPPNDEDDCGWCAPDACPTD